MRREFDVSQKSNSRCAAQPLSDAADWCGSSRPVTGIGVAYAVDRAGGLIAKFV